jgi:alkanesulfonate monooxygenase SsuD/methylene tetrahydromethanopterin reductase-like flavin-dependent oxidoreductase (luciferase family)
MSTPFGAGSVSIGLHPPTSLPAGEQVGVLLEWARVAERAGFDGVTLSEHHAGFPGYMPAPIVGAGWILENTERVWAGPAAMVLGLRNPMLVAEELAWLAARHPGRVGAAFAPGYVADDFEAVGVPHEDRKLFPDKLASLAGALSTGGPLGKDAAVAAWAAAPAPLLSAGNSRGAVERAASHPGMGLLFPGAVDPDRLGRLAGVYRDAGGNGNLVGIRALWVGTPPDTPEARAAKLHYEQSAAPGMRQAQGFDDWMLSGPPDRVIDGTAGWMRRCGVRAVNIRLTVGGVSPQQITDQIAAVGEQVLPGLRAAMGAGR